MSSLTRLMASALLMLGLALPSAPAARAGTYPDRPVTVVLPFGAGSGADRIIRVMLPRMEELLGQKIILDYKTGGGAVVGSNYFMTTKPDGYTLLFYNQPHITMQSTFQKTAYNNDNLVPVFGATWRPDSLNVLADGPFKTLDDLVTYARENPGKLTVGTTGSLSSNHLSFALFSKLTGLQMTRVPFNSAGKMNAALLGGQIDATFNNLQWLTMYPGKLRVLATASTERLQPDIPTFTEQGYPEMVDISAVNILYARKGTPEEIVERLRAVFTPLLTDENIKAEFIKLDIGYGMFDHNQVQELTDLAVKQTEQAGGYIKASMQ